MSKQPNRKKRGILRAVILERDGNACFVCGRPMVLDPPRDPAFPEHPARIPAAATFEHILEVCEGGQWNLDNLALSHLRCNVERSRLNLFVKRFGERCGSPKKKWLMPQWPALPMDGEVLR